MAQWRSLLLVLALSSLAWAKPFVVESFPPGAEIYEADVQYLGRAGESLDLSLDTHTLTFRLPGHDKETFTVSAREIQRGRYNRVISLPPLGWRQAVIDQLRHRPLRSLMLPLGLLAAVLIVRRLRRAPAEATLGLVGKYRLLERIGHGGAAEVYRAVSESDPAAMPVALKRLHENKGIDSKNESRFRREIQASLRLEHAHLGRIYDWGEDSQGRLYLVTELFLGETLRQRLLRGDRPGLGEVVAVASSVGSALAYLHEQGLVHRDVKPENIFVCKAGPIKLMDLGLLYSDDLPTLTDVGMIVGTPHYIAPDQVLGECTQSSDQYALGVTLFEMLAGQRPFRAVDPQELLRMKVNSLAPKLGEFWPEAPAGVEAVLDRMLAIRPEQRFPSVADAVTALCSTLGLDDDGADTLAVPGAF